MIPIIKVLGLLIRVFARPLINKSKEYHLKNFKFDFIENYYVYIGYRY